MSNLFALADVNGRLYLEDGKPVFFTKKPDAKIKRRSLNKKDKDGKEVLDWVVTRGPDHWLGPRKSGYTPKRGPGKKKVRNHLL